MPWPWFWSSETKQADRQTATLTEQARNVVEPVLPARSGNISSNEQHAATNAVTSQLRVFSQPQTLFATLVLTAACLGSFAFYRSYLKRIPEAVNIKPSFYRRRSILGKVTSVGDGDNFRIYHTPGGWLAGWGWLPWKRVPTDKKELRHKTASSRSRRLSAGANEPRSMFV